MTHPISVPKPQQECIVYAPEVVEVVHISFHGKPVAVLLSEQTSVGPQGKQQRSRMWEVISQCCFAGLYSHPANRVLAPGVSGDEAVKSWRGGSVGREVLLT